MKQSKALSGLALAKRALEAGIDLLGFEAPERM